MKKVELIVRAGWVLPIMPENSVLQRHSVVISEGKIIDICAHQTEQQKYEADKLYILTNSAVMPSFVNCHTHLAMSYFRGLGDDLALMDWLNNYIWPSEAATVGNELVYDGTKHAVIESIRSGVGCVNDNYFFMPKVADVLSEAGIKGAVGNAVLHFGMPWAPTVEHCYQDTDELYNHIQNLPNVDLAICPHSPYGTDDDSMQVCVDMSEKYKAKLHIHLHESEHEVSEYKKNNDGLSPVEKFFNNGWLTKDTIAVHMTQLTDDEIAMVKNVGASIVHCPESNMKLASGISPVQRLIDEGINVALGTDGAASNNDLDMIGEMRSAAFLSKVSTKDPSSVSAETVLKMATYNGAKALGMDDQIGSLEVGKSADMIAIDLAQPETLPVYNPVSQIVYAASRDQITHLWINGKSIMDDRNILTLDEKTIIDKSSEWKEKILKAIN